VRLLDLRHSAASLAVAAGVDLKTVSSNLGMRASQSPQCKSLTWSTQPGQP
jgi:site-specific recombinase XerD